MVAASAAVPANGSSGSSDRLTGKVLPARGCGHATEAGERVLSDVPPLVLPQLPNLPAAAWGRWGGPALSLHGLDAGASGMPRMAACALHLSCGQRARHTGSEGARSLHLVVQTGRPAVDTHDLAAGGRRRVVLDPDRACTHEWGEVHRCISGTSLVPLPTVSPGAFERLRLGAAPQAAHRGRPAALTRPRDARQGGSGQGGDTGI